MDISAKYHGFTSCESAGRCLNEVMALLSFASCYIFLDYLPHSISTIVLGFQSSSNDCDEPASLAVRRGMPFFLRLFNRLNIIEMENQLISIINGSEISAVKHNGEIYVPVKPICQAIGVDPEAQRQRINRHYILNSTAFTLKAVAGDEKEREMLCLPLEFIYGWLFTIDAGQVAEDRREAVAAYQRECYETLYRHFAGSLRRRVEENEAEIAALKALNEAIVQVKEAKAAQRQAEERLEEIRKSRLGAMPQLDL